MRHPLALTVLHRRGFSTASEEEGRRTSSDEQYRQTGEYDTNDKYSRVGNPIQWANPTGGGQAQDTSHNAWKYVYPVGLFLILFFCFWNGRKNRRKEEEERLIHQPSISGFTR